MLTFTAIGVLILGFISRDRCEANVTIPFTFEIVPSLRLAGEI